MLQRHARQMSGSTTQEPVRPCGERQLAPQLRLMTAARAATDPVSTRMNRFAYAEGGCWRNGAMSLALEGPPAAGRYCRPSSNRLHFIVAPRVDLPDVIYVCQTSNALTDKSEHSHTGSILTRSRIMVWVGLTCLGIFFGWIIGYGIKKISDWGNPGVVFSAVLATAVPASIFTILQTQSGVQLGNALYVYPAGLAYGLFCSNLGWVTQEHRANSFIVALFIIGFIIATILLITVALVPGARHLLEG